MVEKDVKRGCNRLSIVLTLLCAAYVLLIYPIRQQARLEKIEKSEFLNCWQQSNPPDFKGCAAYAKLQADASRWSLNSFYPRVWWSLALIVIAFYGCCRGTAAIGWWIYHGFRPNTDANSQSG